MNLGKRKIRKKMKKRGIALIKRTIRKKVNWKANMKKKQLKNEKNEKTKKIEIEMKLKNF